MTDRSGIDIVTRLYDLADLPHLDRLVFSVMGQVGAAPLRLHVMLQRLTFSEVQAVRSATAALRLLNDRVTVCLHNWDYPAPFDLRVPLLNYGLEIAPGRYFTCVDVHDQLRPSACAAMLGRLQATPAAIALGGAALQPAWWWGDVVVPIPHRPSERSPASAFMIDRLRIAAVDCVFRNAPPGAEIGDFVRALTCSHETDTALQSEVLLVSYVSVAAAAESVG